MIVKGMIKELLDSGMSMTKISQKADVHPTTIWRIYTGKTVRARPSLRARLHTMCVNAKRRDRYASVKKAQPAKVQ